MVRKGLCAVAVALVVAAGTAARAEELINSDFENGAAGWTVGGADNLSVNGFGVLADSTALASLWAYNTTYLPLYMSLDLDYMVSNATATDPFVIGLHVWGSPENPISQPSGSLQDHYGYFLAITESTSFYQVLELQRRDGLSASNLEVLAGTILPTDGPSSHHLRWTDCGCGRLDIYVDDLDVPILSIDDSRTGTGRYIGRTGTFLGVGTPGEAAGWIDNVLVEGDRVHIPEPLTIVLVLTGVVGLIRRR